MGLAAIKFTTTIDSHTKQLTDKKLIFVVNVFHYREHAIKIN